MKPYICIGPITEVWLKTILTVGEVYYLTDYLYEDRDPGYGLYDRNKKPMNQGGELIWLMPSRIKLFTPSHHEFDNALEKLLDE